MLSYRKLALCFALAAGALATIAGEAQAGNRAVAIRAARTPWHGSYYETSYGYPIALVVPPNSNFQSHYSWGVAMTEMRPVYHQFGRTYPGDGWMVTEPFLPTPRWPGHTDQFGVYSIRGPW